MFFWRHGEKPSGGIYDWILANKQQILAGTAEYMGTPVTETTEFYQYKYVVSVGVATLSFATPHDLPTAANGYLRFAPWKYALITLLLGWWCFPWGPPVAIHAIVLNLGGGRSRTAGSLLQLIEWGWDVPDDFSATAHKKKIIEISTCAAEEIRSRMAKGGFSNQLGVRITPTKWADSEVEIAFDYPVSDGRDWIDESEGLLLLIDKKDEQQLSGCYLEFANGRFSTIMTTGVTRETD